MNCPECKRDVELATDTAGQEIVVELPSVDGLLPVIVNGETRLSPRPFFMPHKCQEAA